MIVKPSTSTATIRKMGSRGEERNFYNATSSKLGPLNLLNSSEPVQLRIHRGSLQLLPIVLDVNEPSADVIGLFGGEKQGKLDLFRRGHSPRHANSLRFLDFAPPCAVPGGQDLVGHHRIAGAWRNTIYLDVVIANFLGQTFGETHQRCFCGAIQSEVRASRGRSATGEQNNLAAALFHHVG